MSDEFKPRDEMDDDERADFDEFRGSLRECLGDGLCLPCFDAGVSHAIRCVGEREPLYPRHGNSPRRTP